MTEKKKPKAPSGHSRAAQNRKIRRDALREELRAREYIRQVQIIANRLDPDNKKSYQPEEAQMAKHRADIYFRLLDKCLPSLRPVDMPIYFSMNGGLVDQAKAVLLALANGEVTPSEASTVMQTVSAQARIIEIDELEKRVSALEKNP